eukprot:COSAG06_NODE_1374_length_9637_cov_3.311186_6_plen_313_part_00
MATSSACSVALCRCRRIMQRYAPAQFFQFRIPQNRGKARSIDSRLPRRRRDRIAPPQRRGEAPPPQMAASRVGWGAARSRAPRQPVRTPRDAADCPKNRAKSSRNDAENLVGSRRAEKRSARRAVGRRGKTPIPQYTHGGRIRAGIRHRVRGPRADAGDSLRGILREDTSRFDSGDGAVGEYHGDRPGAVHFRFGLRHVRLHEHDTVCSTLTHKDMCELRAVSPTINAALTKAAKALQRVSKRAGTAALSLCARLQLCPNASRCACPRAARSLTDGMHARRIVQACVEQQQQQMAWLNTAVRALRSSNGWRD